VSWFDFTSQPTLNRWQGDETNWLATVAWGGIWNDLTEPEDDGEIPLNGTALAQWRLWIGDRLGRGLASGMVE
jgi:alpha-glucosidase (family GH31 glycosyl hydrolase)